jgi:hypothetical protein
MADARIYGGPELCPVFTEFSGGLESYRSETCLKHVEISGWSEKESLEGE